VTESTRSDLISDGELVDYTDITATMGYKWPTAVTRELEEAVQRTLPPGLQIDPGNPGDIQRQVINEQAMGIALFEVFDRVKLVLKDTVEGSPAVGRSSSLAYVHDCGWHDDETIKIRIRIEADDDGEPCFTLGTDD